MLSEKMVLNINKRACMLHLSRSPLQANPTLHINGTPLQYINQYKYLGLHFSSNIF